MKALTSLLFLLPIMALGETYSAKSITVYGVTYKNVTVKLSNPSLATITHEEGIKKIDPSDLDQEIAEKIGYNFTASVNYSTKRKAASDLAMAKQSLYVGCYQLVITVISSVPGEGILGSAEIYDASGDYISKKDIFLETNHTSVLSDSSYKFNARHMGRKEYTTVLGASRTVEKYKDLNLIFEQLEENQ